MSDKLKKEIIDWAKTIVISLVLAFLIVQVIKPTIVSGESMYPTLNNKDYLILNRLSYKFGDIKRGDIIVFKTDLKQDNGKEKDLIKRVIATEGDHLVIKDSQVYLNDKLIEEPYIDNSYTSGDIDIVIPDGEVFVMGDNRENSKDSRSEDVGLVNESDILGEVMIRLLPLNKVGPVD
ncbi:signal peptidase I [Romboutsia ilealis]|uniref:Signal peptidase I n=1 Tax=Romboutsia faecis TaxID=2764597 RepID=A0ABR7JS37_9FIRM|nr:signal peptidase I [Romboutsia faecis]MBC5997431.1 signal peptidase I [Romboutsia faecis]MRN24936.1 signal peptidase I [Romboutsia ilealis]